MQPGHTWNKHNALLAAHAHLKFIPIAVMVTQKKYHKASPLLD